MGKLTLTFLDYLSRQLLKELIVSIWDSIFCNNDNWWASLSNILLYKYSGNTEAMNKFCFLPKATIWQWKVNFDRFIQFQTMRIFNNIASTTIAQLQ